MAELKERGKLGLPQRKLRKTGPNGRRWLSACGPLEAQEFQEDQTQHRADPLMYFLIERSEMFTRVIAKDDTGAGVLKRKGEKGLLIIIIILKFHL